MTYPIQTIRDYADKKITRQQFINQFRQMQKAKGLDYACKGTKDKSGIHLTYRGTKADVRYGMIHWNGNHVSRVSDFKRMVDIDKRIVWIKKPARAKSYSR